MTVQLLTEATDCQWLRETHLAKVADLPEFHSFMIFGNEDCPERLELYAARMPFVSDAPVASYVLDFETAEYRYEARR